MVRTGFEKVHADLKAGRAGLLLAASDGAADGRAKLATLAAVATPPVPVVALFDSEALSAALGHEGVVHATVAAGGMAERLMREVGRLEGMREQKDGDAGRRGQQPR